MKRIVAIEIDCGNKTCGDCDWFERHLGSCDMFGLTLEEDVLRLPECLAAEGLAVDMFIKKSAPIGAAESKS